MDRGRSLNLELMIAEFRACVGFHDALPKLKAKMLSLQIEYGFK
jgi:hypothetical protein